MTTAAHLDTINVGLSDNDGRGSTIRDAFMLVNNNINKLNFQLNSDGTHSAQYAGTYLTLTNDLYANAGTIQGATVKASSMFVNGSPVLTSQSGGWAGGMIPYYGIFANTDPSYSTTTGVVQVAGGVGIQGNLNLGGLLNVDGNVSLGNVTASGKLAISSINTTGTGTFNQLSVAAGSTLAGTTLFAGPSTFNGSPAFNAVSAFNNDATFFANVTLNGTINGSGGLNLFQATLTQGSIRTLDATSIQARAIGNVTPGSGAFTTLTSSGTFTASGQLKANSGAASTSTTTGALIVAGGAGVTGDMFIGGNLTVQGTTLTVNTEIINQSVVIATSISSPTVIATTLNAATIGNISANHVGTGTYLTSLNGANLNTSSVPNSALANSSVTVTAGTGMSGGGTVALGGTVTLTNAGVTGLTAGAGIGISASTGNVTVSVSTTPTFASISHSGTSGTGDIGSSGNTFGTVYATATSAKYADVAENYKSDAQYEPGTVVAFGGTHEVTVAEDGTRKVAGVVSTDPAYLMNSCCDSEFVVAVALQGRVPVKVRGKVEKGDMMVSAGSGFARADFNPILGSVIGKALEDFNGIEGVIEVVVGRL
jgi:hypothetical protein